MLNSRLNKKISKKKILKDIPDNRYGNIGDMQIAEIQGKGTFLCLKDKDGWKISDVFKQRHRFNKNEFDKIKAKSIFGKSGRVLTLDSEAVSYTTYTDPNTGTTTAFNRPILKVGDASNTGVVSSNGNTGLLLKSGASSSSSLSVSGNYISASINSTGIFTISYNDTGAASGQFAMMNVAAGDCYQNIQVTNAAKDPYTRYAFYADDPSNNIQWCVGMDGSNSKTFKWLTHPNSTVATTVPSSENIGG